MSPISPMPQRRVLGLTVLFVALVVLVISVVLMVQNVKAKPRSIWLAESSAQPGWQTLAYRDAQVDVPADWERMDVSNCDAKVDGWAPPAAADCDFEDGVVFRGSVGSEPAEKPGVLVPHGTAAGFEGYEVAGKVAVWVGGTDEATLRAILDTVKKR